MADCEMCGKSISSPIRAVIEGTTMIVCAQCAQYGERLADPKTKTTNMTFTRRSTPKGNPDDDIFVVENYGHIVKSAREKKRLKQEQVAKAINEKESIIHKIESGHFKPSIKLARKLEKYFGIKLTEHL